MLKMGNAKSVEAKACVPDVMVKGITSPIGANL